MKKRIGFTLVELLVVVSIIAILTGVGLAVFTESAKKSRDARRRADIESVRSALEMYRADHPATGYSTAADYSSLAVPLQSYIDPLPSDPGGTFEYTYTGGGTTYTLCAIMESGVGGLDCVSP